MIYPWQRSQWQAVQHLWQAQQLPHALLLQGVADIGKRAFAQHFAQALLCHHVDSDYQACGVCKSCRLYQAGSHPDTQLIQRLDDKKEITIEQIRRLIAFLQLSQSISQRKVVVIHHAETLNINAANSLLKTLEEPAANTFILLDSAHPAKLLPTIRSRCQRLLFALPNRRESLAWLQAQSLHTDASVLLTIAGGKPLLAQRYNDENRLAQRTQLINDIGLVMTERKDWLHVAKQWEHHDRQEWLAWQLAWVNDLARLHYDPNATIAEDVSKQLYRLYELSDPNKLYELYDSLISRAKIATHTINPLVFMEDVLICWKRVMYE
ncbi:MAG: DNA polymerase III subunit delta' [bacterium]